MLIELNFCQTTSSVGCFGKAKHKARSVCVWVCVWVCVSNTYVEKQKDPSHDRKLTKPHIGTSAKVRLLATVTAKNCAWGRAMTLANDTIKIPKEVASLNCMTVVDGFVFDVFKHHSVKKKKWGNLYQPLSDQWLLLSINPYGSSLLHIIFMDLNNPNQLFPEPATCPAYHQLWMQLELRSCNWKIGTNSAAALVDSYRFGLKGTP